MNKAEFTLKHGFYFTVATTGIGFLGRKLLGEKIIEDPSISFENFMKLLFVSFAVSAIEYKILSEYIDKRVQSNVAAVKHNIQSTVKHEAKDIENKAKKYFSGLF